MKEGFRLWVTLFLTVDFVCILLVVIAEFETLQLAIVSY
jgi:hypothetical protein